MALSALLSGERAAANRSKVTTNNELLPQFIHDESQLPCVPPERPDLHKLNNCLEALSAVFPDIQIEVFRELLSNFEGESRLALVADALLKNRASWVKGRWRVLAKGCETGESFARVDGFRSPEYKHAVRTLALQEFKGLSRSTIEAVLAESNFTYIDARRTLADLSSKSWRFTISSLLFRRKPIALGEAENHPLVVWRSSGHGSIVPAVRATGSAEFDRELFETLIVPLKNRQRAEREEADRLIAVSLNSKEAVEAGASYECECCFAAAAFEEFSQCNYEGHMICFRCIQASVNEAIFGQGWLSSIDLKTGTLKCLSVEGDGCTGHISTGYMHQAMSEKKNGADILHKLDRRLAKHSLLATNLPLIHCPSCDYAEIDEIYTPAAEAHLRPKVDGIYNACLLVVCAISVSLWLPASILAALCFFGIISAPAFWPNIAAEWTKAVQRHCRRRRGLKFTCQNPDCKHISCLSCHKPWADIHVCNESSLVALRTQVEQAMSLAVKRVCPRCNTSFVKNSGCNKLTCPCGYKMCYVCRADLGDEGYRHFCDHFRPDGDPRQCKECDRCNLWESEDTDRVLREAKAKAERKWKELEKRDLSGSEQAFLETGYATKPDDLSLSRLLSARRLPACGEVLDAILDTIFL